MPGSSRAREGDVLKVGLLPNLINRYPHEFSGGSASVSGLLVLLFLNRS